VAEGLDLKLPNALSAQVFDEAELVPALTRILSSGREAEGATNERRRLLSDHIAALEGPLAAERIADVLVEIDGAGVLASRVPSGRMVSAHLGGRRRQLVRFFRERRPDSRSNRDYLRHKFPGMPVEELQRRIHRLQATRGGFNDLRVRELAPDVFELTV
jgi:hypothetical protein